MLKKSAVLKEAEEQLGVTEYPPGSNNVEYNTWYYGRPVSGDKYPWCVTYLQWLFRKALIEMLHIKTASSSTLLTEFEKRNQVVCENLKQPGLPLSEVLNKTLPGDIVFFKFNWKKDCKAEHVGLAYGKDSELLSIEGNTSFDDRGSQDNGGAVALRHRRSNIVAVVRPVYEKESSEIQNGSGDLVTINDSKTKQLGFVNTEQKSSQKYNNDAFIWNFFKSKGLNDFAIAGLMGNLQAESGLCSNNLQNSYNKKLGMTDEEYTSKVDDGSYINFVRDAAGYGLAQWTYHTRKQSLLVYANSTKRSIGDLEMQCEFLWRELQGYKTVLNVLKTANSIREASDIVLTQYERPANMSEGVKAKRAEYGITFYNRFKKG